MRLMAETHEHHHTEAGHKGAEAHVEKPASSLFASSPRRRLLDMRLGALVARLGVVVEAKRPWVAGDRLQG
jgi:hypothetical protein